MKFYSNSFWILAVAVLFAIWRAESLKRENAKLRSAVAESANAIHCSDTYWKGFSDGGDFIRAEILRAIRKAEAQEHKEKL